MKYDDYNSMSEQDKRTFTVNSIKKQDYKCVLCGESLVYQREDADTMPVVDHDHKTGKIRGTLHSKCNRDLGVIENRDQEWINKAHKYLAANSNIIDVTF